MCRPNFKKIPTIAEILKERRLEIFNLMIINSLDLKDNLIDLKIVLDKIDDISINKISGVREIERITRKVLQETKTKKIEEKEQILKSLKLKSKIYKYLEDYEEEEEADKITKTCLKEIDASKTRKRRV